MCTGGWRTGENYGSVSAAEGGIRDLSEEVFEKEEHLDTQEGELVSDKAVNSEEERRVVNEAFDANS